MNIRALIHHLVGITPNARTLLLEAINHDRDNKMAVQMLNNKLNHNNPGHSYNVEDLDMYVDTLGFHIPLARYFAEKGNGVVIELPDIDESDMALLDGFMQITKELGDVGMKFQQAYADGDIDAADEKAVSKEIDEAVTALLAWKKRIQGMRRG